MTTPAKTRLSHADSNAKATVTQPHPKTLRLQKGKAKRNLKVPVFDLKKPKKSFSVGTLGAYKIEDILKLIEERKTLQAIADATSLKSRQAADESIRHNTERLLRVNTPDDLQVSRHVQFLINKFAASDDPLISISRFLVKCAPAGQRKSIAYLLSFFFQIELDEIAVDQ